MSNSEKSEITTTRLPNSTADRISNLPCNVTERILAFLPIKAAVQTSILSRNWRHRWRITPQLVFDESFRNGHDESKLMVDIYGALLLHDGPITKFELAIRGSTVESSQVDRLILHLSRTGVRELALQFSCFHYPELHSSLFSAFDLKALKLERCHFGAHPSFVGFLLENDAFPISSYSAVKYELDMVALFASLPALQQLTLGIQLLLIDPEDGGSSPSDVIASLRNLLEAEDRPGVCCLQHLEELHIQDSRGTRVELDLVRFVLATTPQLHEQRARMATRLHESTADRISNLPDGAIERILVFLPVKDAARTSLLSRDWRNRWRSIPQLVFDDYFAPTPAGNSYLPDENKVMMQVYEALMGHDGPIAKFELSISGIRNPNVDILMRYISSKGVQELSLLFWECHHLQLYSSLFFALPLNRLRLQYCTFSLASSFVGFSKLNLVEFNDVFLPDNFYENFIPNCPLLEELSSIASHNPDMVSLFASLPALQHLNLGIELLLFLADGHVPYQLPTALHNLKFLEVPHILLHRLPQAQLDDDLRHPRSEVIASLEKLLEAEDQPRVSCLQHLEEFNIQDSRGTQVELDLVRFVLATAPSMTADRISNLPGDVIDHILKLLPINDAARTSLLSRSWRHRRRSIPQLVFDGNFAPLSKKDVYLPNQKKVMVNIYEAVLVHDGPMTKFELAIPGFQWCPQVDLLMLYLSGKDVEELTLFFWGPGNSYSHLHSSLFSAFDLKRLKLQYCQFCPPSGFSGFSKLTFLQLEDVGMPDGFFENFIPKFPLLEELRVTDCGDTDPVFESHSLKVLFFRSSFLKICFKDTPVLSVLSVLDTGDLFCGEGEPSKDDYLDMVPLFASLPALQQLNLGIELLLLLAAGRIPYRLPTDLHHLEVLEIPRLLLDRLPQARVLVCLIMSSPNLQTLTIRIDDDGDHPLSEAVAGLQQLLEGEDQPEVRCLQHLEEFNIQDGRGTQVELDLVRFVLATAPKLRRISIKPHDELSSGKVLKFLKNAALCKRISRDAELRYVCDDADEDEYRVEDEEAIVKSHMKRLCELNAADGISSLPDDVITRILTFLPIVDAARTSLLSRNWRHRWRSKGIQDLTLRFEDDTSGYPRYQLHSSLFSAAFPLKRLTLQYCKVRVPSCFEGFKNLTLLDIALVDLPNDFYENFLPLCPLLEELSLFASLPALERLDLGSDMLQFLADNGHVPYQLPKPVHNLKFLKVPRILLHRLPQVRVLVCLIMSAPNLKRLTIQLGDDNEHPPSEVVASLQKLLNGEDHDPGVCCLQHLEEFNIQDSRGMQVELDMVRFVLATAPKLRRISINPQAKLSDREGMQFLKEVTLCKRISRDAEVVYL
ncbi:unnamed protein product [Linum tenue]|uniref:F-box domain-containing protein n=1 Tax=Linum tenue TaxID=586396 RepID=A0AAV0NIL5_9ROSI|nr:unnamed protein product [Linum tenue]